MSPSSPAPPAHHLDPLSSPTSSCPNLAPASRARPHPQPRKPPRSSLEQVLARSPASPPPSGHPRHRCTQQMSAVPAAFPSSFHSPVASPLSSSKLFVVYTPGRPPWPRRSMRCCPCHRTPLPPLLRAMPSPASTSPAQPPSFVKSCQCHAPRPLLLLPLLCSVEDDEHPPEPAAPLTARVGRIPRQVPPRAAPRLPPRRADPGGPSSPSLPLALTASTSGSSCASARCVDPIRLLVPAPGPRLASALRQGPACVQPPLRAGPWVYTKRENADSWNSGLEKEQILETYSAQLQKC
nr:vegetative cell wall protein gp1-like [Aegilops tauschii subsp. strangulata]